MFAVPGWNLSSTVKQQTVDQNQQKSGRKRKRQDKPEKKEKPSKQRKTGSNDVPLGERVKKSEVNDEDNTAQLNGAVNGVPDNTVTASPKQNGGSQKTNSRNARRKKAKEDRLKLGLLNGAQQTADGAPNAQLTGDSQRKKERGKKDQADVATPGAPAEECADDAPKPAQVSSRQAPVAAKVSTLTKAGSTTHSAISTASKPTLTPLQAAMAHKLSSARFRHLNETLYTTPSSTSLTLFSKNPEMFDQYHLGFSQQVAVWPENPVDNFISDVQSRASVGFENIPGSKKQKPQKGRKSNSQSSFNPNMISLDPSAPKALPRNSNTGLSTIADLGCGTARLASTLTPQSSKLKLHIHSFDLHSPSPLVTKADISALPLRDGELDVVIFCLALMGTNWTSFIDEAWRCLRWKGECWVGEIRSRFGRVQSKVVKHSVGAIDKRKILPQPGKKGKTKKKETAEDDDSDLEEDTEKRKPMKDVDEYLNTEIDDPDHHASVQAAAQQETDLAPFLTVMRNHGFALQGEADLSNKMFVKIVFTKSLPPTTGKNKKPDAEELKKPKVGKNFLKRQEAEDKEMTEEMEGKVLKPCLYKLR